MRRALPDLQQYIRLYMWYHQGPIKFFVITVCLHLTSCAERPNYIPEIQTLDSLTTEAQLSMDRLRNFRSIDTALIASQTKYVQHNFVGAMRESMARTLSNYSSMHMLQHSLASTRDSLDARGEILAGNCALLSQSLKEKATHDAINNEMTTEYIVNATKNEKEQITEFSLRTNEWLIENQNFQNQHNKLIPQIQHWVDSIPQKKTLK